MYLDNSTTENRIKIVDDIMGSGKSTWAINYINQNPDKRFLCITPLLSECMRYEEQTDINISDPKSWGTKWNHFKHLVAQGKSIVTTHSLIQKMDLDVLELLKNQDYILMIDECLDVLSPYKISKDDIKIIFNERLVDIDDDGFLVWNEERKPYKGAFADIKRLCSLKSLMGFKNNDTNALAKILMWNFPVDFFKCFDESFIFTYLWEGSIQKAYFDIHGLQYQKFMLNGSELVQHDLKLEYEKRRRVADLINIYEGKLNKIGTKIGKTNPLSKTWYENKLKKDRFILEVVRRNTENFFRTASRTVSSDNMYSVFKFCKKHIKGKGYSKGFISCNARGINQYRDKKALAYLLNYFMYPDTKQFVSHYKMNFSEDLYALSALLHWIWRSQIRDGKPIQIYVPSERMRLLLKNWLSECKQVDKAAKTLEYCLFTGKEELK